jgi:hypothetical protein
MITWHKGYLFIKYIGEITMGRIKWYYALIILAALFAAGLLLSLLNSLF